MLPLLAMLDSQDPQQFTAAASAIAELANPDNTAFQVSVIEVTMLQHALQDNNSPSTSPVKCSPPTCKTRSLTLFPCILWYQCISLT